MAQSTKAVSYRRTRRGGTIRLQGAIDIHHAADFHAAAICALKDDQAQNISIQASSVERMDASAVQIIAALRTAAGACEKTVEMTGQSDEVTQSLRQVGIAL